MPQMTQHTTAQAMSEPPMDVVSSAGGAPVPNPGGLVELFSDIVVRSPSPARGYGAWENIQFVRKVPAAASSTTPDFPG